MQSKPRPLRNPQNPYNSSSSLSPLLVASGLGSQSGQPRFAALHAAYASSGPFEVGSFFGAAYQAQRLRSSSSHPRAPGRYHPAGARPVRLPASPHLGPQCTHPAQVGARLQPRRSRSSCLPSYRRLLGAIPSPRSSFGGGPFPSGLGRSSSPPQKTPLLPMTPLATPKRKPRLRCVTPCALSVS